MMFHGILALVGRSLRVDARSWQPHLARFGLMGAIYVSLCVALWSATWFGAPGLRFFYGIAYLNVTFMTLLGVSFFSTTITEEKEEDTLGLMLMAGISPLGILIGKSGGRLVQALLLIAIQYPFTLLAVTMGGVTQAQIGAVHLGLSAYMLLLAGYGLLCSTVGSNNRSAATWMILGLLIYTFVPLFAAEFLANLLRTGLGTVSFQSSPWLMLLQHVAQFSIFQQLTTILTTGFGDPVWSWQVVSNVVTGGACFGLAWALFGACTRQPASEASTRGLVSRGRGLFRWFSPGRAWGSPFVWKDFHFVSGGIGMIPVRLAFCAGLWGVALLQDDWTRGTRDWNNVISFFQVFLSLAVAIDAGRVLARSLQDEIRGQTLGTLMMLPRSPVAVIYAKFAGALLGWIPAALIDLLISVLTSEGRRNFDWIVNHPEGLCISSFFILIPNLAAVLALYMRWGAVPLGIALAFGLFFGTMTSLNGRTGDAGYFIGFVMICICILCHVAIVLRVRSFAAV